MVTVHHNIEPLYSGDSKILILGSMPSPKSREQGFYYGHPQNRFWRVTSSVLGEEQPQTIDDKRSLCLRHHIAMWDMLASCDIVGAADSKIKNPVANDIDKLILQTQIQAIFTTGAVAHKLYTQLCQQGVGIASIQLPSTSPANATWSLEKLITAYRVILEYL